MEKYYNEEDLKNFADISEACPELGRDFFKYYSAVFEDAKLSKKEKTLIALSVAFALKCPYCIEAYTKACLEQAYTESQMTEALHVVSVMSAGVSLVHGMQMKRHIKNLEM